MNTALKSIVVFTLFSAANAPVLADTALHSVTGYTSTADGSIRNFSVLVFDDDGRVLATGDETLLARFPDAGKLDGGGRFVLPGLIDAHAHVSNLGLLKVQLNLVSTPSLEDAVAQIAAYAKANPGSGWIEGRGWNQVLWPVKAFPRAADIDAVVSDRPVFLKRIDGHAAWVNSLALQLAGIDNDTPDPVGGKILRFADGRATGVLVDNAKELVAEIIPAKTKAQYRRAYRAAFSELTSLGMTGVHDAGLNITEIETLMSMADNGEMPMRVYAMISDAAENLDAVGKPIRAWGDDRLTVAEVKLYADGALGSRGAAMLEPYSDDVENRGLPYHTQQELNEQVKKANDMGFQVGIHAIGDYGNRQALNAFEYAQDGKPSPLRNRIEHAQIIALADLPRFRDLGIIAAMQATHATSDMNMAQDRIGAERLKGAYAWRTLLDLGVVVANGSDFPVELPNPMYGLHAAVTRQSRDNLPPGGWHAEQAMTRAEALHSWTWAGAYAAHQEDHLGSLEPGKWADFIIVDRDYFEIPATEIDDIQVLQTWVGGAQVYRRCAATPGAECSKQRGTP